MNKNQQAAIKTVCFLFPIVTPKGDPTEKEVRDIYNHVMSDECTCKTIKRHEHGRVTNVCRKCQCKPLLETAWPFLAEPIEPECAG